MCTCGEQEWIIEGQLESYCNDPGKTWVKAGSMKRRDFGDRDIVDWLYQRSKEDGKVKNDTQIEGRALWKQEDEFRFSFFLDFFNCKIKLVLILTSQTIHLP